MQYVDEYVDELVQKYVLILHLEHWRVRWVFLSPELMGTSLMRIKPNRDRLIATIEMRRSLRDLSVEEFNPLLLHELLHLAIDPIVEEHNIQLEYIAGVRRGE
jgi:hypothetical protein